MAARPSRFTSVIDFIHNLDSTHLIIGGLLITVAGSLFIPMSVLRAQMTRQLDAQGHLVSLQLNDAAQTTYNFEYTNELLKRVTKRTTAINNEQVFIFDLDENRGNFADANDIQQQQFSVRLQKTSKPELKMNEAILAQWPVKDDWSLMYSITGRLENARIIRPQHVIWQKFIYDDTGALTGFTRSISKNNIVEQHLVADLTRNEAVQTFGAESQRRYYVTVAAGIDAIAASGSTIARWSASPTTFTPYALQSRLLSAESMQDGWKISLSYAYSGTTLRQVNRLITKDDIIQRSTFNIHQKQAVITDQTGAYNSYKIIVQDTPFASLPPYYVELMQWPTSDTAYQYAAGVITWYVSADGTARSYDETGKVIREFHVDTPEATLPLNTMPSAIPFAPTIE